MSRKRHFIVLTAAMATVAWAAACGDGGTEPPAPPPDPPRPTTVTVSPATVELTALGETVQLQAEVRDQNGQVMAGAAVTWASSSAAVATVSAAGLVTAVANGTSTITATAGSATGSATVTVSVGSRVTLDSGAGSAPEGGVVTLGLTVDPVPESAISVRYTLGTDGDPVTSDADGTDYTDGGGGVVEIAAGASAAVIEIAINDDDEIESVREVFTVTLDAPGSDAGYGLGVVAAASVTIEEGVCDRTPQVGNEIVQQAAVGDCAQVEDRHSVSIQALDLCFPKDTTVRCEREVDPISALREGDFLGLSGLDTLNLGGNDLTELPPGIFSGLPNLRVLYLHSTQLTELPAGVFSGLSNLTFLWLAYNRLTELPAGVFSGLSNLRTLSLGGGNDLTELSLGIFSGLSSLTSLSVGENDLTELPPGIFSGLSSLKNLSVAYNDLTELPPSIFSGLSSLERLALHGNDLTELPPGIFSGLSSLKELRLRDNPGSPFSLTAEVTRTDSDDSMSPGPATLEFRVAEGVPFAMTIPLSARGGTLSPPSASFAAGATAAPEATLTPDGSGEGVSVAFGPEPIVCEDPESNTEGPKCSGLDIVAGDLLVVANPRTVALSIPAAHLTQGSQDLNGSVPLMAGREALLRVFATADERYIVGHEGQATFFVRGQEVYSASLETPASSIHLDVEEGRLGQSFNARIPGHVLQPGLEDGRGVGPRRGPALEGGKPYPLPGVGPARLGRARTPAPESDHRSGAIPYGSPPGDQPGG